MRIKKLNNTPLQEIIDCFHEAFSTYELAFPKDLEYWKWRFHVAKVDYNLSFGAFEKKKMVGFIIIGIDEINDDKIAFNTGTGVVPSHRGQSIVDQLYQHALPVWKRKGVTKCSLEVLTTNDRAIHVYDRIGFMKSRVLHSYSKAIEEGTPSPKIKSIAMKEMLNVQPINQQMYSWDYTNNALKRGEDANSAYSVYNKAGKKIGNVSVNMERKTICQIEPFDKDDKGDWSLMTQSVVQLFEGTLKINNVDSRRTLLNETLINQGWEKGVSQFEMEMAI